MRTGIRRCVSICGGVLLLACCSDTQAQTPPSSFPNLSPLVGESIEVADEFGSIFTGRLLRVSETNLVMSVKSWKNEYQAEQKEAEVSLRRIQRISRLEKDSVANGLIIGAIAGAAVSAVMAAIPNTDEPMMAYMFLPGVGIGMAVGLIGDASRNKKIPIFQAEVPRVALAPTLTGGRKGVAVSVSF